MWRLQPVVYFSFCFYIISNQRCTSVKVEMSVLDTCDIAVGPKEFQNVVNVMISVFKDACSVMYQILNLWIAC